MKILLITSIYPTKAHPDYGTFVRNVHQVYEQSGHQVTLVAFRREGSKADKLKNILRFNRAIAEALSHQDRYDLINVHYPYLAALPLARRLKQIRIPLLVSVHGSDVFPDRFSKRLTLIPTKRLLKGAQRIIVPSGFFQRKMMKQFGLPAQHFKIAPPGGFDRHIFYPALEAASHGSAATRKDEQAGAASGNGTKAGTEPGCETGMAQGAKEATASRRSIGFVARLVEGKGWRTLLDAFAVIAREPDAAAYDLILAGSGPDHQAILAHGAQLGISERITLKGALPPEHLADFYRELDFFVFPTQFEEALGMVGIEALACGVPVIASDAGGVAEYMQHGRNGLLVEPGDVQALSEAMRTMIGKSTAQINELRRFAPLSVAGFERAAVARRLNEILEEELS